MRYPWEKPKDDRTARRNAYMRAWRAKNRDKQLADFKIYYEANKETILEYKKNLYHSNRHDVSFVAKKMVEGAIYRARKRGLPFDKTISTHVETVLVEGVCELSGFPFENGEGKRGPYSPSLDRIEPELGYVPGNIRVILWCLNVAMNTWGMNTVLDIFRAVLKQDVDKGISDYIKFLDTHVRVSVTIDGRLIGSYAIVDDGTNMNVETVMPNGASLVFKTEGHPRTTDQRMTASELVNYVLENYK